LINALAYYEFGSLNSHLYNHDITRLSSKNLRGSRLFGPLSGGVDGSPSGLTGRAVDEDGAAQHDADAERSGVEQESMS
jgi:hypothetical protein